MLVNLSDVREWNRLSYLLKNLVDAIGLSRMKERTLFSAISECVLDRQAVMLTP